MRCLLLCLLGLCALGQSLRVSSEFQRFDPFGQLVPQDRGAPSREILSPAVARNAWSSFRIMVQLDRPGSFILDIGQNPDNTFRCTLYREQFVQVDGRWIPDGLTAVSIPFHGAVPDDPTIPGQKMVSFWLDVWTPAETPVDRIKLEPQLYIHAQKRWEVYPMEVRVTSAKVPGLDWKPGPLPPVTASADRAAWPELQQRLCGRPKPPTPAAGELTARQLVQRNAAQDLLLLTPASFSPLKTTFEAVAGRSLGSWCSRPGTPAIGPEWYLKLRDFLLRFGVEQP
jgi:hypothetical protein